MMSASERPNFLLGRRKGAPLAERLARMSQQMPNGCIEFRGANQRGYGLFWANGANKRPYRVAYELARGPIPEGMHLDHLCRNPRCINPAHLEPVTPGENTKRQARYHSGTCFRGHPWTDASTYYQPGRTGRSCRICIAENKRRYHINVRSKKCPKP